jgi:MFS family permease
VESAWWLMVVRGLQGLASVLVAPIAQSYEGDITPEGKEGRYMNLFFISFFGGQAVGPAMGGFLSDHFGLHMPFYAMSAMSALALALVFFLVPESPGTQGAKSSPPLKMRSAFARVLGDGQMQGVLILMGSRGFYRWGFNTFFPVLALTQMSLSKTQVGVIVSFYMLAGAFLQYPAGILSDRLIGHRREVMFYGSILSPVMMFLVPWTQNFYLLMLITLMMGIFSVVGRASAVAIRTERGRVYGMGVVMGAFTTSISTGQVLGPVLFGVVADFFPLKDAFYFGGAVGLLGSLLSYALMLKGVEGSQV